MTKYSVSFALHFERPSLTTDHDVFAMFKCCFNLVTTSHSLVTASMEMFNWLLVTCHAASFDILSTIHNIYWCLQPAEILINSLQIEEDW